jgi:ERCC4-related helicase
VYIKYDYISPDSIEQRAYQVNIARSAITKNTLVVLPTGLGKTVIALIIIADQIKKAKGKILFLSPTKPLVHQHTQFLKKYLTIPDESINYFTGEISPAKRKEIWEKSTIIISTPQVIENDLISRHLDLSNVSFIIFDEAHRAVGNYSYVYIAEIYLKQKVEPLLLGMTASPGNDLQKILEVCKNLNISNIEIRTKYDRDVRPYVHTMDLTWKEIPLPPEFSYSIQLLRKALTARLSKLKDIGIIDISISTINRRKLLELQQKIQQELRSTSTPSKLLFTAASTQNAALKIYHAIELMQTQGIPSILNYFQRMGTEALSHGGSKASRDVMKDPNVLEAIAHAKTIKTPHPKIPETLKIVNEQITQKQDSRIIIFTNYRDTSSQLVNELTNLKGIRQIRFIGQASKANDKGLTQKTQNQIITQFKEGTYNVLIATSVAEEGLDIPSTDLVVFYEPVPSEIRTIQRRGRTARKMPGKVIILIAKGTPDEGYYWSAKRKEKQMRMELETLRSAIKKELTTAKDIYDKQIIDQSNQKTLESFQQDKINIIVDHREYRSTVTRFLSTKDILITPQQLDVGDYVLSTRIGVERKNVDDYLSSLLEGKLFHQMKQLRDSYSRPILIIEGEGLLTRRNIGHTAIFGSIVSIIVDYGISIITTKNPHETADFLYVIAKREQLDHKKDVAIRGEKWSMSLPEHQQFMIEGLPNISVVLAKRLLHHFGSIYAIVNATEEELCQIQGIGKATAAEIIRLLHAEYTPE